MKKEPKGCVKKTSPKKETTMNYACFVVEQLKIQSKKGTHFDLKVYPVETGPKKNEVTVKMYFNGRMIKKTAKNKRTAEQLCYQEIKDRNLI